ncbi:MAG: EAL domain-containing protein [Trueperaceae bacterium]
MRRRLWAGLATIVALSAATVLLTQFALRTQEAATLFVYAESQWSKGRSEAVSGLFRFATSGQVSELEHARRGLGVLETDMRVRLALEAAPPRRTEAIERWIEGGRTPREARAMVDFFLQYGGLHLFAPSVTVWSATDDYVRELSALADAMEAEYASGAPSSSRLVAARSRVLDLSDRIRPLERAFSRNLADAVLWLRNLLLIATTVAFVLLVLVSAAVIAWAYRALRERDDALRRTFEQATVGMAYLDEHGRFTSVNEALARLLGRPPSELLGRPLTSFVHEDDRPSDDSSRVTAHSGRPYLEWRALLPDGSTPWLRSTFSEVRLGKDADRRRFATFEDVSETRRLTEELRYRARHDMLTGLVNRYEFERRLDSAIAAARRSGRRHAVLLLDLDQFKVVNDTSGHAAGDALLSRIAAVLEDQVRTNDLVARMGGDEFAVLLDDASLDDARTVGEKIRRRLAREEFVWEDRIFPVTVSIGAADVSAEDGDVSAVLRRADVACYLAKDAGRDRIHVYAVSDEESAVRHGEMEWVGRIRSALKENRLVAYAQRIVPAAGASGLRYELLLRLRDRDGELHPPGRFLPAAERYGVIGEVDRWVVRHALETLERHVDHVAELEAVHLNVSAGSVSDPAFATDLIDLLDHHDVPGDKLCIEITETAAMRDLGQSRRFLATLRSRGVQVALDDFGSGLSSFAYLKSLPIDLIKIDGLLVRDVATDPLDRTLVRSVHELARVLGKRTVAEFVENGRIADMLRTIGVDLAQGYGVHRPEPWTNLLGARSATDDRASTTEASTAEDSSVATGERTDAPPDA